MTKRRYLEIFIFETILWLALWLVSDYLATLLTVVLGAILVAILLFSLVAELIERSKVPASFFIIMALSIASGMLAGLFYLAVFGGSLSFLGR